MTGTVFSVDLLSWAVNIFKRSVVPDARLLPRLISVAASQAADPTASTSAASVDKAEQEGAYRLLNNPRLTAAGIEHGPFAQTVEDARSRHCVLAIQDTTSVSVKATALREELKSEGNPTGFVAHSTLALDAKTGEVIGLADQQRWLRAGPNARDKAHSEGLKWFEADQSIAARFGADMSKVIQVSDREGDCLEYLSHLLDNDRRFIIRGSHNRNIGTCTVLNVLRASNPDKLLSSFDLVADTPVMMEREITIEQRGAVPKTHTDKGRPSRKRGTVTLEVRASPVTICAAQDSQNEVTLNLVHILEKADATGAFAGEERLEWFLWTSESIETPDELTFILKSYERRWTIEEFHKSWKTGCRLEERTLQSEDSFEKLIVIAAPIGVRLLQLQCAARSEEVDATIPSTLDDTELRCLWAQTETKPLPAKPPSAYWALHAIAKLGRWKNSKRTGRIGWSTLWKGWAIFQERLAGWVSHQVYNAS